MSIDVRENNKLNFSFCTLLIYYAIHPQRKAQYLISW